MVIADIEGSVAAAEEIGRGTVGVACDVASSEGVAAGIAEAVRALGGLDLLVNNAGVGSLAPLHELTEEEFDRVVAVNLRGTWLMYKHAVPALVDGGGAIINIASVSGLVGFPLLGVYSATKGAVIRMTETMALELRDHGVRANAMCPGFRRHRHGCVLGHRFHCGHRYAVRRICRQGPGAACQA
jgi:NAD(P)-dependent dehydrogenase (short-subunit alcohol dehydrogenase family)